MPQGQACTGGIFRVEQMHMVDTFVYFSHNLVSIPPPAWTNVGHAHGALVLGTFITEWDAGREACAVMLRDDATADRVVDQLVAIATYHGQAPICITPSRAGGSHALLFRV